MGMFGAIDTAGSGLTVYRKWLDAVSDNIANINTARRTSEAAFQSASIVAASVGDPGSSNAGVVVSGVARGNPQGRLVSDPSNPLADAQGMVRMPDIDLGDQMVQMIMAQRGYQANLAVVDRARDAYLQALQIGRTQ